ncbi:MAG: NADH-quinone oxidoreductase subunit NuoN [Actinomycetota bacterium]|nr:NADH-quinone oxidoreductase subunit NuoN [Actinomycetota bacterium]
MQPQPQALPIPEVVLFPILPEIVMVVGAVAILIYDAVRRGSSQVPLVVLSVAVLSGAAVAAFNLWTWTGEPTILAGMVATDRFAVFFRLLVLASAVVGVLFAAHYFRRTGEGRGELYPLLLFATSGMTLMVAAADLIVVFLALEVLSLSLYVMSGFSFRRLSSQEASLKYFLLGSFSSAFFLYGIALTYGAAGTTSIAGIAEAFSGETGGLGLGLFAAVMLTVGFAFKVAAVPFHMWTPDVYQGAPTPVTGFMAAGTKVAAFAALLRVISVSLGPLQWDLLPVLWGIAVLSMVVGSVLAIAQNDIKRMLAYSSIAHAGFTLIGVAAGNHEGISGAMFYLVAYAAMILGAFGVVMLVSRHGEERLSLSSYTGLLRQSPMLAALLALFMLSLAGIPPTAGFIGKVLIFQAAVRAGLTELVVIGVLATVVAAFFYIRVLVLAYMKEPDHDVAMPTAPVPGLGIGAAAVVTLVLGVFPALLLGPLETAAVLRW